MLLEPKFWLAFILYTAVVIFGAYTMGSSEATFKATVAEQQRTATALAVQRKMADAVLAQERELRDQDRTEFNRTYRELRDEKDKVDLVVRDLQRDVSRLRVPVRPRSCAPALDGGPPAPGTVGEGYAELTPDAATFVVDLLARGDKAIRKHAAVVDAYERLRQACMTDPPIK